MRGDLEKRNNFIIFLTTATTTQGNKLKSTCLFRVNTVFSRFFRHDILVMGCDLLVKWICLWDGGGQALVFFLVKNLRVITPEFFSMCYTINYFTCIYTTILIVYSVLLSRCLNFCAKVSEDGRHSKYPTGFYVYKNW